MTARMLRCVGVRSLLAAATGLFAAIALVCAPGAGAVSLYPSATTSWLAPFDMPFAGISSIATSPEGEYVYVGTGGKVIQYTTSGVWVRTWSPYFEDPSGLATDPSGDVYVADSARGEVQKFDANGRHIASFSAPGVRQIAADAHGHIFVLTSIVLAEVVDVRSYNWADEGAWAATLPGSWFQYTGYQAGYTSSIAAIATDPAGDVILTGISGQHLEGAGPDCHSVFEANPGDTFAYDDPLLTGEVARFTAAGAVVQYGWPNATTEACYPGWFSLGNPTGVAVSPDDSSIWLDEVGPFFRHIVPGYSELTVANTIMPPCLACENPPGDNYTDPGAEAFDCHGNLYVGTSDRVLEFYGYPQLNCPSRSIINQIALAPALTLVNLPPPKKKKVKKGKALDFVAGCHTGHCTISVLVQARLPGCGGRSCTTLLASGRFTLAGGRAHTLSLALSGRDEALLRGDPALNLLLSARLLRHGRAVGPTFRAGGGKPLLARLSAPLTLSCPAQGTLGAAVTVAGTIGVAGVHTLTLTAHPPSGPASVLQVAVGAGGSFAHAFALVAGGTWTFDASFAGDRLHSPAGAGCATEVPSPPSTPKRIPLVRPPVHEMPESVATTLTLNCPMGPGPFTGTLTPAIGEAPITITYHYIEVNMKEKTLIDEVKTTTGGTYSDTGPMGFLSGEASASWPGSPRFLGASSNSCSF